MSTGTLWNRTPDVTLPPLERVQYVKVLFTADAIGGVWSYALELARQLSLSGVEVALATMGSLPTADQRAEAHRIEGLTLWESRFKLEWMDDPWDDVRRAGDWLLGLQAKFRADLVHLSDYAHCALAWEVPTLVVGHSCVLSWWEAVKGESAPPAWDRYRQEVARGLRSAVLVVAPSAAMLQALERHYGPLGATRLIPNGRDPERFRPTRKRPLILAAGRVWDQAKNLAAVERVAPLLPWPVYIAGELESSAAVANMPKQACFLGRLETDELARWLGRCAVYVHPARYEPFGLSILEAAFAGSALVLGDIPSLRELWDDAALFVAPDDHEMLAQTLLGLIADTSRRLELAHRSRSRAMSFTAQHMSEAYLAAYRELLGGASKAGTHRRSQEFRVPSYGSGAQQS
ncbi:MAG TPA: glycosyltransferase family 4 protein [Chloroflexota bacterium]|nr:glycosyltransferase family 4 protein [Chloroflexota bacterium]